MGDRRSGRGGKSRGSQRGRGNQQSGQSNQPQSTKPPKPQLPKGNSGENGLNLYGKEVHDIWVYRRYVNTQAVYNTYNVCVDIDVDGEDVRHYTQNQIPRYNQDQDPQDNFNFSVRIPACLFAWTIEEEYTWDENQKKYEKSRRMTIRNSMSNLPFIIYMAHRKFVGNTTRKRQLRNLELYRRQTGSHLMINGSHISDLNNPTDPKRWIVVVTTYWTYSFKRKCWDYDMNYDKPVPFQCVHPSLTQPDGEQPKIIIGLLFLNKDSKDICTRSYERRRNLKQSRRVQDIYESFIELKEVQDGTKKETKDDAKKEGKTKKTDDKGSQDGNKVTDGSEKTANNEFHYSSQTLFPVNEEAVVIYVCEGARLIVRDELLYKYENGKIEEDHEEKVPGNPPQTNTKHCRNLMQQGTLIVLTNCDFRLCMEIRKRHTTGGARDPNSYRHSYDWEHAIEMVPNLNAELNDEDKEDFDDKDSHKVTQLNLLKRKVLFIGANESQHNSICWALYIDRDGSGGHSAQLVAPGAGRLLDVTTWNTGFKLINCRHRYQKLYESLINGEALTSAQWMQFGTPNQQILERVLGIKNSHPMNIRHPNRLYYLDETNNENLVPDQFMIPFNLEQWDDVYHRVSDPQGLVVEQIDTDVRRCIDARRQIDGQHYKWAQINSNIDSIPVPPLYPPVYDNQTYSYTFKPQVKIAFYDGQRLEISDRQRFKIGDNVKNEDKVYGSKFEENCPEYKWSKCSATEVTSLEGYHSSDYRIGIDYHFYKKEGNQQIGQIGMWTLQVQSSNTSSQPSQTVASLSSQVQNVGSHSGPSLDQPSTSGSQSGSSRGQQSTSGPSQGNTSSDQNQSKRGGQRRRQNK